MKTHFSYGDHYGGELVINESEFCGTGAYATPLLQMPMAIGATLNSKNPQDGIEIAAVNGKLWIAGIYSASASCLLSCVLQKRFNSITGIHAQLDFPATPAAIAQLEIHRKGGDIKFVLDVTVIVRRLVMLHPPPREDEVSMPVWGFVGQEQPRAQVQLVIPRDTWIQRVLHGVGYGSTHILEFPAAPLKSCAALDHAFKALQQAQEFHSVGLYDDAAGKCRVALDQFFEFEDRSEQKGEKTVVRRVPVVKKSWATQLGAATYTWLDATLGAVKEATNRAHHSPNAHHSQFDSQMILAITTAVVAYIARTLPLETKT